MTVRRVRGGYLLVFVFLLTACATLPASRTPVRLTVVDAVFPPSLGGAPVVARVVGPNEVAVLRGYERDVSTVAHELVHVAQWRRDGLRFPIEYLRQVGAYGYERAPYEVEARALAGDPYFVGWAEETIEGNAR